MDKHPFDKVHTLNVYRVDELDRLEKVPEEYKQPERAAFDEKVRSAPATRFRLSEYWDGFSPLWQ
jgi:hypothetical protein